MKVLLIILFFIISLFAKQDVILQLSWKNQFQFAGYYVAKEMGYYDELGINVTIKEIESGINPVDEVNTGRAQFGVGRSSLIVDRFNGKNLVALAAIFQSSPLVLLSRADVGIESIEDLKNKNMMITYNATSSASLIAMLKSNGLDISNINLQKHSFNTDDLISQKTDAMASYISNEPIYLEQKNIPYKIFDPKNYGFDFYDDFLFTSQSYLNKNKKLVNNFYKASLKGWEYAFKNKTKTAELIYKKYNSLQKSKIALIKEAEILEKSVYGNNHQYKLGKINLEKLKKIEEVYRIIGLVSGNINHNDFVYKPSKDNTYQFTLETNDIIFASIIVILLVLLGIVLTIYTSVQRKWLITNQDLKEEVEATKTILEQQKKEIKFQLKKLETVLNGSDEIIILKDEHLNYIECNSYFASLFDLKREDILGKNDFFLYNESFAKKLRNEDKEIIKNNQEIQKKSWLQYPKQNKKIYINAKIKPFEYEKGKIGILIFGTDITKIKQLEDQNLKNQKLAMQQSKINSMSKLLQSVSHQWRQPLSIITMVLNNIKMSYELQSKIEPQKLIENIDNALKHSDGLSRTLNDFGEFFDAQNIDFTYINSKDLFSKLNNLTLEHLEENHTSLHHNIDSINFNSCETQLLQSLVYIINNSIDAFLSNNIPNDKRDIFIDMIQPKDENIIQITIKDNGGGIKEDIIGHIFEPYFTTKHSYIGVGLSLYIVYHYIVNQFNGTIDVENTKFSYDGDAYLGACVTIKIPLS